MFGPDNTNGGGGRPDPLGALKRLADGGAMGFVPLTRTGFGIEALGPGFIALALLALAYLSTGCDALLGYGAVWLVALARQRLKAVRREREGRGEHSRYTGWPWLVLWLSPVRASERGAKQVGEPLLCLVLGAVLAQAPALEPLGLFLLFCGGCIFVSTGIDTHIDRMRLRRLRDAELEQRQLAAWYRNGGMF